MTTSSNRNFFVRYCPFVKGIHPSQVTSDHKSQWRGALMFSLICAWINIWVNNHETGDLRRHHVHYDVIVMVLLFCSTDITLFYIIWVSSKWYKLYAAQCAGFWNVQQNLYLQTNTMCCRLDVGIFKYKIWHSFGNFASARISLWPNH